MDFGGIMADKQTKQEKIKVSFDQKLLNRLKGGFLLRDLKGKTFQEVYLYDPKNHLIDSFNINILKDGIKDFDKHFPIIKVDFVYDPNKRSGLTTEFFNEYMTPKWRLKPETIEELPDLYVDFFDHLTENEDSDKSYILDWLSYSLFPMEYEPFLCLIGKKGIGKGLLSDIIKGLHGEDNMTCTGQRILSGHFNAQLINKTMIYLDEIRLKNDDQMNVLKLLINNSIEVEGKKKDAKNITNHASVLITSNNFDIFTITKDERRFSIPFITNIDLMNSDTLMGKYGEVDKFYKACVSPDNIGKLGNYLLFHYANLVKRKMSYPFKSTRTFDVISASLKEWELEVVDFVNSCPTPDEEKGDIIYFRYLKEIKRHLTDNGFFKNERLAPGKNKMVALSEKLPNGDFLWDNGRKERYFSITRKGNKNE